MLPIYIYSIASVIIVSLVSLVGVFLLSIKENIFRKYIYLLVSLAVGALLGDAFIHLIPESFKNSSNATYVSLAVIAGILIFFILEKFLHWHHHAQGEEENAAIHPTGQMVLVSDGVHNFIDGLIIGASYLISIEVGIATTLAVMLHEIPQEIGDFGVLIYSGFTRAKALLFNFISGTAAIVGVLVSLFLGSTGELLTIWLLPFAAGGFIYIAMCDLIPELNRDEHGLKHSILQLVFAALGIIAMLLLLIVG